MNEVLMRVDVSGVKEGVYKELYTVPAGHSFVVSRINVTSANILKLKINGKVITETSPETKGTLGFFNGLVLNSGDVILVTHSFSGANETVMMSGSLVSNT